MKVLLLIDSLVAGGRERRLIELIKGLRKNYTDVNLHLVVFKEHIHYKEVYDLGIPVQIMKRVPKKNPKVFYQLYKLCKSFRPDIIHSWGTMSSILAIPSVVLLNIKLINGSIVDSPNHLKFYHKLLFRARLTYPFSKVIISNSLAGLRAYRVPENKGMCIYNGFDGNRISNIMSSEEVRKKFEISTPKVVAMVGSFSARKDYKTYLEAALIVLKNRDDVTFLSVGDGPDLRTCKELIPQELKSRCIFTGIQSDVESIINMLDVGVLSTNTKIHGEGISNAILEYMALKKPTVATEGGGTNEAVEDKVTGFLVKADSAVDMANKISYLLENKDKSIKLGLQARERMEQLFLLDRMTDEYYNLYKKVV